MCWVNEEERGRSRQAEKNFVGQGRTWVLTPGLWAGPRPDLTQVLTGAPWWLLREQTGGHGLRRVCWSRRAMMGLRGMGSRAHSGQTKGRA